MDTLFRQWTQDHQGQAWSLARYLLKDPAEAEDVVQEAFIRLWENRASMSRDRVKPIESVSISFDQVFLVSAMKLVDRGEFSLHASESDMQKAILLDPSIFEEGFKPISYEKKVEPGFVDVYGIDKNGKLVVVELKRKTAGRDAALQLAKYVDCIKAIANRELRGVLVAPRLAKGVQTVLTSLGLEFKALSPQRCSEVLKRKRTSSLSDFFR